MTTLHSVGEILNGFRIVEVLEEGYFTFFYRAEKAGREIFLKQYKEPSSKDRWFKDYLKYEQQVKRLIDASPFKKNTIEIVDIFEWKGSIFQALEFVPNRTDLWDFIIAAQDDRPGNSRFWDLRVLYAKMLMDCVKKLHASGIIHSDLKPQNIVLLRNESIRTKYLFRVADLDWSIIDGVDFPWDYAKGTVGYCSPEHIRGVKPFFTSDVFTCGIILYLLLCNYFPFDYKSRESYKEWALNYDHYTPVLLEKYPGVENEVICRMLELCLHPDPTKRPTAKEVHDILLGRKSPDIATPVVRPDSDERKSELATLKPSYINCIQLVGPLNSIKANIQTDIGRLTLKGVCGEDSQFADIKQYTLVREDDSWFVIPNPDATNETLLNGKKIIEKTLLKSGDQIGVGREEKEIIKAVVTVK